MKFNIARSRVCQFYDITSTRLRLLELLRFVGTASDVIADSIYKIYRHCL